MTIDYYVQFVRERVNLRVFIVAIGVATLGFILLWISAYVDWLKEHEALRTVVRDFGSLLLVIVVITFLWEFWGKRVFLDEVLAKAHISKEISFAGLIKITDSFHSDIDWKAYFRTVDKLDIFFAYGRTWRNTYELELKQVASKENARIRVVLPDPEDEQTVAELARRFNLTPESLKGAIRETEAFFRNLRKSTDARGAQIDIWFLPAAPSFSFYRFDRVAILALYSHRHERAPVPTFICEMGGTLYDYIRKEFDAMIRENGLAKRVTDS